MNGYFEHYNVPDDITKLGEKVILVAHDIRVRDSRKS